MSREELLRLAREAGFAVDGDSWIHAGAVLIDGKKSIDKQLSRLAALVAERDTPLLRQALEALEYHQEQTRPIHRTSETITALKERLGEKK